MNEKNCECDLASKSELAELKERIESLEKNHHLNYIEKRFHELYKFTDEQVKFTFNLPNKPYHDLKERIENLENTVKDLMPKEDKPKVKKYYVNVYHPDLFNRRMTNDIYDSYVSAVTTGENLTSYIKTISFEISDDELK